MRQLLLFCCSLGLMPELFLGFLDFLGLLMQARGFAIVSLFSDFGGGCSATGFYGLLFAILVNYFVNQFPAPDCRQDSATSFDTFCVSLSQFQSFNRGVAQNLKDLEREVRVFFGWHGYKCATSQIFFTSRWQ